MVAEVVAIVIGSYLSGFVCALVLVGPVVGFFSMKYVASAAASDFR